MAVKFDLISFKSVLWNIATGNLRPAQIQTWIESVWHVVRTKIIAKVTCFVAETCLEVSKKLLSVIRNLLSVVS